MSALSGLDVGLVLLGLLALVGAVRAVTATRVVHAALWLVVAVVSVAGTILVLGGELVGLSYVLIYVGAIVVLVLFALMLTRAPMGPDVEHAPSRDRVVLAALTGAATTALLLVAVLPVVGGGSLARTVPVNTEIAQRIFGTWVWPFELLSVLLLVALVAALALARIGAPPARRTRLPSRHAATARGEERR